MSRRSLIVFVGLLGAMLAFPSVAPTRQLEKVPSTLTDKHHRWWYERGERIYSSPQ